MYCPDHPDIARAEWLERRKSGIGGSDAACILGLNPWKSNVELWEEKTGRREPEDIGWKPVVQYGKEAEKYLRGLFELDYPQYAVSYDEFGMIANIPEYPWLFATLDGDLTEEGTGRKGVLEIKTTEIMRSSQWNEWGGDIPIPQHYYIQVLHQLLATGYDFAVVRAQIKHSKGASIRDATIHRELVTADLEYLLKEEIKFWECVREGRRPALILPEI